MKQRKKRGFLLVFMCLLAFVAQGYGIYAQTVPLKPFTGLKDGGVYGIESVNSGSYLTVENQSLQNKANIRQWEYLSQTNQLWRAKRAGNFYVFISVSSKKALSVAGGSLKEKARLLQYTEDNSDGQRFLVFQGGGVFHPPPDTRF